MERRSIFSRKVTQVAGSSGLLANLLEQGTQTPSPAPDLIPAETRTENSHWDWYSERGHFTTAAVALGTACAAILNSCLNALQVERQTGQTRSKKCTNKAANHLRLRTGQIYNTRNSDNGQGLRVCEITSGASTRA